MAVQVPTQLVLYDNDAVDVSYSAGSRLQLSPCAASFVWTCPPKANQHPLQGTEKFHLRTEFVTSAFRYQVKEAIEFRNRFAERPYLFAGILEPHNILKLHANITEVVWKEHSSPNSVEVLSDGSRKVQSGDNFATVTLSPCGQTFTVEYLAKASQPPSKPTRVALPKNTGSAQFAGNADSTNCTTFGHLSTITPCSDMKEHIQELSKDTTNCTLEDKTIESGASCANHVRPPALNINNSQLTSQTEYTWVVQHFSTIDCPPAWDHPLKLLQEYDSKVVRVQENSPGGLCEIQTNPKTTDSDNRNKAIATKQKQNKEMCIVSELQETLPISCKYQHLHKWQIDPFDGDSATQNGKVKVLCSKGIIYKLNWGCQKCVEVYPGDGSIMRSNGMSGQYFSHYFYKDNRVEEKTYSVRHPPPNVVGEPYPKAQIIQKAARLLDLICSTGLPPTAENVCCWKVKQIPAFIEPISSVLLEETTYPGLGKFTAFSNGRIRVLFENRTNLIMQADFSRRIGQCLKHSGPSATSYSETEGAIPHDRKPVVLNDIPKDMCRLLLPNGKYIFVDIKNPGSFAQYVQPALEWVAWVNTSPSDRYIFYKDTIHDPLKNATVNQELARINCFNYLLDMQVMPDLQNSNPSEDDHYTTTSGDFSNLKLGSKVELDAGHGQKIGSNFKVDPNFYDSDMVKNILQRNSQTVKDLDTFLSINEEISSLKD